ncbi:hypothetical protein VE00_08885 [Pseudogymnoascus sp. WSF 3629]|nr:hypothetical protein VE00_08885 [Pseudogymnoascus sp. WSF 3629]
MTDDTPNPPTGRRGSFSSTTFSAIFGPRGAPTAGTNGTPGRQNPSPPSSTTSTTNPPSTSTIAPLPTPPSRRRMSISTLGLSGSPLSSSAGATTFFPRDRRASIASSTASSLPNSAVSESAIEDDSPDSGSVPTTPFSRHMSFGGSSGLFPRGGGGVGPTSPQTKSRSPSDAGGLNWSEQFRERAASAVHRPMMGSSPPAAGAGFGSSVGSLGAGAGQGGQGGPPHVRARSEGGEGMVAPARTQPVPVPQQRKERRKPDEVGERMLRGEFYMD